MQKDVSQLVYVDIFSSTGAFCLFWYGFHFVNLHVLLKARVGARLHLCLSHDLFIVASEKHNGVSLPLSFSWSAEIRSCSGVQWQGVTAKAVPLFLATPS